MDPLHLAGAVKLKGGGGGGDGEGGTGATGEGLSTDRPAGLVQVTQLASLHHSHSCLSSDLKR